MFFIYALVDPDTNLPFYIGKGSGDRPKQHLYETKNANTNNLKWCKIQSIRNNGNEPIIEYIETNIEDEQEAYDKERDLIKKYGRKIVDPNGILTNICEDNRPPPALGRVLSEETKRKIGDKQVGELNHRFGKHWSEEEKERRRNWALENGIRPPDRTGVLHSDETKAKMSIAAKGKKKSQSHVENMSKARKGKNTGPRSEEQKKNMSLWQQRLYILIDPSLKEHRILSRDLQSFCKTYSLGYSHLLGCVKSGGKYKGWTGTKIWAGDKSKEF